MCTSCFKVPFVAVSTGFHRNLGTHDTNRQNIPSGDKQSCKGHVLRTQRTVDDDGSQNHRDRKCPWPKYLWFRVYRRACLLTLQAQAARFREKKAEVSGVIKVCLHHSSHTREAVSGEAIVKRKEVARCVSD